ncbi:hypothetical protein DFQ01_11135 [Paenibacillus cellulosilyticus]|uniref:DUF1453 domain-containing protein n=1 Tax=Paenibacillus cellulosilyticus TaxID=375489 RepID=A0A2V2YS52_9BACL|nr:hypothetical protein [Paenibacillus cellulosilyticus]PWW00890.1 hypothetical protein DFQ01_11135 [Paenibacillus cellulosilyticus]QKS47548.1 hypothetical protein HUB94_24525 [Paenibacillus cellulosilyticus]
MQQIIIILLVCLVGFRIVRRVQRNFSWSELRSNRLTFRIVLLAVIGIIFMTQSGFSIVSMISDIIGILIGAALGIAGATMTVFERRGAELYYKANVWIGTIVTVLFVGRFAYRMYEMMTMSRDRGQNFNFAAGGSHWTSGLMLIMFAYYVVYYVLLMRQGKQVLARS